MTAAVSCMTDSVALSTVYPSDSLYHSVSIKDRIGQEKHIYGYDDLDDNWSANIFIGVSTDSPTCFSFPKRSNDNSLFADCKSQVDVVYI